MSLTNLLGSNDRLGHYIARRFEHFSFDFEPEESLKVKTD